MTGPADLLRDTWGRVWAELEAAAASRPGQSTHPAGPHAWRSPALATVGLAGEPQVRTVILREVDAGQGCLGFYTDARSPKVQQIGRDARGALLFWSPALGWQLRVQVQLELHTAGLAVTARWARLRDSRSAGDYLAPLAPGSLLEDHGHGQAPSPEPELHRRTHFALIEARVTALDWLELAPATGHRRALFDANGHGRWVQA